MRSFSDIFPYKPIIGMIHLAGNSEREIRKRAREELEVYHNMGVDAAIVENYHCRDVRILERVIREHNYRSDIRFPLGVNILPNEYAWAFAIAHQHHLNFIQLDFVAGEYEEGTLNYDHYKETRRQYPDIIVLGGVHPKYYTPIEDANLTVDLNYGLARAEAIVVTGQGTGKETPIEKIKEFRRVIGNHPLVIGAGLTPENAREQLALADGAIVGSTFKRSTKDPVHPRLVKQLMDVVRDVRRH